MLSLRYTYLGYLLHTFSSKRSSLVMEGYGFKSFRSNKSTFQWQILHLFPGESLFPAQHRPHPHHQAEGDTPGRVESVHEGSACHSYSCPSAGNSVCPTSLQTCGACHIRDLWLPHEHLNALSGGWNFESIVSHIVYKRLIKTKLRSDTVLLFQGLLVATIFCFFNGEVKKSASMLPVYL